MKNPSRTKQELLEEITALKQRTQALEKAEADNNRDRESLLVYEERYRLWVNNTPDIIYSLDGEGNVVTVNSSAFERYGYTEQDSKGKPFIDFIHPDDREIVTGSFLKAIEEQRKVTAGLQFRIVAGNGFSYWFELNSHARFDNHGRYIGEDGVLRDITERKFRENEGELNTRLNELINMPGNFRKLLSELTACLQGWSGCEAVGIRLRAEDDYPYYETRGFPPAFVHAENHLCAYDTDGKIVRDGAGNPVLDCMCGNILCGCFDPAQPFFTGKGSFCSNNTTVLLAGTTEADRQARTRNRCNGEGYESVALIPLRTGDQVFGLLQFNDHRPDRFTPGLIDHLERIADSMAIALSRRQDEDSLRGINERLSITLEVGNAGVWEWDIKSDKVWFDPRFHALLGYSPGELPTTAQEWKNYHHPEDLSVMMSRAEAYLRGDNPLYESEHRIRTKAGTWNWILTRGKLVNPASAGSHEKFIGIAIDITSRKQAEEKIQNSETFLNRLIEQSPTAMWISDDQGNLIRLNQSCCDLLKIAAHEVVGRYNIFQDNIVKEQGFLPLVKAVFEQGETARFEIDYNSSHVDGLKLQRTVAVILDTTIFPIKDTHGRITHAVIQHRDITEQRQAEEALRKSDEMLRLISENMSDMIRVTDLQGNNLYSSPSHFKCLGYKPDERVGKSGFDIVHPDDVERIINKFAEGIAGHQKHVTAEYRVRHADGHYLWLEAIGDLIWDAQGNPLNVIMTSRDITERKQTEALLHEREALFQSFFESAVETMFLTAPDGRIMAANPAASEMFGWTEQEFIEGGRNILVDVTDPRLDTLLKERLEKGKAHGVLTYVRRDGTKFQGEVTSAVYKDKDGNQKSSIIVRDITERLRSEDDIKNSEKKYRLLHESMMDGFVSVDMNGKFLECNEIYRNMLGYSETELAALTYTDVTPEKWHAAESDIVRNQIIERGYSDIYEKEYRRKDGTIFPIELHTVLIRDEQSKPLYMWAIARDITERKQAEEKLAFLKQQDELILSSAAEGILGVDLQGNHTFVNPAAARMLGYKIEELLGRHSHSIWHHTKPDGSPYPKEECPIYAAYRDGLVHRISTEVFWRKDCSSFPVEYASTPIYENGRLVGAVVTFSDISERKQAENQIKALAMFPSENPNPVLRIARDGTLLYINQAGLSLLQEWHLQKGQSVPSMLKDVVSEVMNSGSVLLIDLEHGKRTYSSAFTSIVDADYTNVYFRDITERKQAENDLKKSYNSLNKALAGTVQAMASVVESRDPYTAGHQRRVAELSVAIASEMDLPTEQINGIRMAAVIHDLGKIVVPAEILSKPTKLKKSEFEILKDHPYAGYDILKDIDFPWPVARIVLEHHEKIDGTGYPNGLVGENILLESKILTVADVVEAMASHRPYRPALGIDVALNEIEKNRSTFYDSTVADACQRLFREKGFNLKQA